jgi:multiple sugar transport system substrate-binding protein
MRKPLSKPVAALAAFALAGMALAGCGRESSSGAEAAADAGASIDDSPATGTIDVWAMGTEGEKLGAFVKAFEKQNPKAHVKVTAVPWEAAHDKISNAIAAGQTPDVALIGTTWMGEFAEAGGLDPTPKGFTDPSGFFQGAWDSTVVGGTSYGVPWYVETRVLYYRTDLAAKAGWDQPPTSWDELKQFAKDLHSNAGVKYGINLPPGATGSWQTFMPFAWSNGASLTNDAGTKYTIDSPQMVEALEYYKSFFDEGLSPTRTLDPGELESGFADGTYGSFISGPWHTGLVEDAGVSKDEYAVAPLPGKDSAPGTSFVGGGDLAVFKDSDNRQSAWKLVRWLTQPDVQQDWYETVGDLPSVTSAWDSGKLANDPQLQVFGTQLKNTSAPPAVPTWEQVAAVVDRDTEKATKGAVPVKQAVSDMQSEAQSIGTGL